MKKTFAALALTVSSLAFASTWDIDGYHASAGFTVRHMMISNVSGKLGPVSGVVELDDKDVTKTTVSASIDVKGVDTQNPKRDEHLRSPDFFDVEKFPAVTFKSTKVEKGAGEGKLKVTGDLTIHGVTKSVTLDAELSPEVVDPFYKVTKRAVTASGTVNRKDFGLVWNKPMANNGILVGEDVKIAIDAELAKKEAAPAKK
jgi:polyisoprenoid-binding protein YceI